MKLFYIRHGDPCYSPDSLTSLGKQQAELLAKRLTCEKIDRIYSSTSQRAIETAQPLANLLGKEVEKLDWCSEYYVWDEFTVPFDSGKKEWCFFHKEYRKIFNEQKIKMLGNNWHYSDEFKATSFQKGMERINLETDNFLRNLGYIHDREKALYYIETKNELNIALFAHQGFGLAFLSSLFDIPYPFFSTHFDIMHTGITVVEFNDEGGYCFPKIIKFSDTGHLYFNTIKSFDKI